MESELDFVEWYESIRQPVLRLLRRRYPGRDTDQEDILQEVALLAWRDWSRLCVHPNPAGWAVKTAKYLIKHRERISQREKSQSDLGEHGGYRMEDNSIQQGEIGDSGIEAFCLMQLQIREMIRSSEDGELLYLHLVSGYTYRELAAMRHLSEATLRKRGERAKARLRAAWTFGG